MKNNFNHNLNHNFNHSWIKNYYHPSPSLQSPWNCLQFGLLTFPISPFIGGLSIMAASLITWTKQYHTISDRSLHKAFGILSLLLIITTFFAQKPLQAALGLWNFLPFFLFFAGLTPLFSTPNQMRQISWIMVFSSLPIMILGFGQLFFNWNFKFQFLWIVVDWIIAKGGEPVGRMSANFMHANTLAAYLVTIFILGLGLCLEIYQTSSQKASQISPENDVKNDLNIQKILVNIYLHISVICTFIALILTNSRNGWGIAIMTCFAYSIYKGWRLIFGGFTAITTTILLAAYGPLPIAKILRKIVPYFIWGRLNDQMYANRPVELMRKTQWEFAWNLTQQHPLTGTGLRSFSELYKQKMNIDLGHPHNLFLMLSAETGLITTTIFCGLLICIFFLAMRILNKSKYIKPENRLIFFSYLLTFIAWIMFNTVDVTTFDIRLNTLSWVFIAALCGVSYRNLVIAES